MPAAALLGATLSAQAPATLAVAGVVTDAAGRPIADVTINAMPIDVAVTGADGRYTIKDPDSWVLRNPDSVVRFTADGYVPATRPISALKASAAVVLRRAAEGPRTLTTCSGAMVTQSSAGELKVPTPKGVQRKSFNDDDSVSERWSYGKAWLSHGSGPMWSWGLPSWTRLARLTTLDERDVRLPIEPVAAAPTNHFVVDVRGIQPDGKRSRYVAIFMETFDYEDASAAEAAFFDRMLDAMCYAAPKPPPAARP